MPTNKKIQTLIALIVMIVASVLLLREITHPYEERKAERERGKVVAQEDHVEFETSSGNDAPYEVVEMTHRISDEEYDKLPAEERYDDPTVGEGEAWKPGTLPSKQATLDLVYDEALSEFEAIGVFAAVPAIYDEPVLLDDGIVSVYVHNGVGSTVLIANITPERRVKTRLYGSVYHRDYIGLIYDARPGSEIITEEQAESIEDALIAKGDERCYEVLSCDGTTATLQDGNGEISTISLDASASEGDEVSIDEAPQQREPLMVTEVSE